jgi:hypothetical protein
MRQWRREWVLSPRRRKMERIDESFPFNEYRKRQYKLTRNQASTLFQVRSGHIPLNSHLHRINKSETKLCQQCEPNDEAHEETVTHFLFECIAYTAQRQKLARTIGRHNLNLEDIMASSKYMKALSCYITKTRRFPNNC